MIPPKSPSVQFEPRPSHPVMEDWTRVVDAAFKQKFEPAYAPKSGHTTTNSSTSTSTSASTTTFLHEKRPTSSAEDQSESMASMEVRFAFYVVSFNSYLEQEASALISQLRLDEKQQNQIIKELFKLSVAFTDKPVLTAADIGNAHLAAQKKLIELRQTLTKRHPIQVFQVQGNKIAIIKPAPPITNLVFKGGGMRGQGYVAVLNTLESYDLTKNIKNIAGTSAGAITAACLATGMSAASFANLTEQLDMEEQMGMAERSKKNEPQSSSTTWKVDAGLKKDGQYGSEVELGNFKLIKKTILKGTLKRSAEKLLHTFQRTLRENVRTHLNWQKIGASPLSEDFKKPLRDLLEKLEHHSNYQITFGDLALLHNFDPAHFKMLTLTGYNKTDHQLESFDVQTVPDMPIATAMRASMAIPKMIAPVKTVLRGQKKTIVDGGVGANVPSHLLNRYAHGGAQQADGLDPNSSIERKERAMAFGQTMVLSFDDGGAATQLLTSTPQELAGMKAAPEDYAIQLLGINSNYISEVVKPDNLRFHEAGPNAYIVHHGKLKLSNFTASREKIQAAQLEAEVRFMEQVRINGLVDNDRAISLTFNSIKEACASLSDDELQAYVGRELGDQGGKSPQQLSLEKTFGDQARKWVAQNTARTDQ